MAAAGRGLDWFNFFVANVQTGFGPFIAVYIPHQSALDTDLDRSGAEHRDRGGDGEPGTEAGAVVDAIPNKTRVAAFSVLAFTACALMFANRSDSVVRVPRRNIARRFQLHPGPGNGGDESGHRRTFRHGVASRPQRPLRGRRQWLGRRAHGRLRTVPLGARRILPDGRIHSAGARGAAAAAPGGNCRPRSAAHAFFECARPGPGAISARAGGSPSADFLRLRHAVYFRQCADVDAHQRQP